LGEWDYQYGTLRWPWYILHHRDRIFEKPAEEEDDHHGHHHH